jgi:hypothetical protein
MTDGQKQAAVSRAMECLHSRADASLLSKPVPELVLWCGQSTPEHLCTAAATASGWKCPRFRPFDEPF